LKFLNFERELRASGEMRPLYETPHGGAARSRLKHVSDQSSSDAALPVAAANAIAVATGSATGRRTTKSLCLRRTAENPSARF